jgi:hypothetical protein
MTRSRTRDHPSHAGGDIPFWVHQVAEMLLGGLLLIEGARTGQHTAVLFAMGGALLLLSLTSDGALGAWPWIGRRVHRLLDFAAAAVLAVSPLFLSVDSALPVVILEAAALGMVWLAWQTNWAPKAKQPKKPPPAKAGKPRSVPGPDPVPDQVSQAAPAPAPAPSTGPAPAQAPRPAPALAEKVGGTVARATTDAPRRLGRAVGRARTWSRRPPTDG